MMKVGCVCVCRSADSGPEEGKMELKSSCFNGGKFKNTHKRRERQRAGALRFRSSAGVFRINPSLSLPVPLPGWGFRTQLILNNAGSVERRTEEEQLALSSSKLRPLSYTRRSDSFTHPFSEQTRKLF